MIQKKIYIFLFLPEEEKEEEEDWGRWGGGNGLGWKSSGWWHVREKVGPTRRKKMDFLGVLMMKEWVGTENGFVVV